MEITKTTPKDFFLWVGAVVTLYVGIGNYIGLLWDYINYTFPSNTLSYNSGDLYQGSISWEMAALIVLTPVCFGLLWLIRRDIARDASRREVWVRRWALYLTLFLAGATAVIDLVYVLYAFLNGSDITAQFLLKALVVLLIAAIVFMHFIADLWNYWEQYPRRNHYIVAGTAVLVLATIIAGFFIVGTPWQARVYRQDTQRVSDLQTLQYQITNYWQHTQALPTTLANVRDPLSGVTIPVDPATGAQYVYQATAATTFKLCATFGAESQGNQSNNYAGGVITQQAATSPAEPTGLGGSGVSDNWQHTAGQVCFTRTINPKLYPPITSQAVTPVGK